MNQVSNPVVPSILLFTVPFFTVTVLFGSLFRRNNSSTVYPLRSIVPSALVMTSVFTFLVSFSKGSASTAELNAETSVYSSALAVMPPQPNSHAPSTFADISPSAADDAITAAAQSIVVVLLKIAFII